MGTSWVSWVPRRPRGSSAHASGACLLTLLAFACHPPSASKTASSAGAASAPAVALPGAAPAGPAADGSSFITADLLRDEVSALASDALEGRGPGTRGDALTRAHLVARLEALGLRPGLGAGGDAGWEQAVELVGVKVALPASWTFARGGAKVILARGTDFVAGTGLQSSSARLAKAELVFVGYGIEAPEFHWDDFKGRDVRGKVLVFLNNDPDWDPALFAGTTRLYYGRWTYKYENALRHGAVGALIVHTTASAGYPYQVVQTSWGGEQFALPNEGEEALQVKGWLSEQAAGSLATLAGTSLEALVAKARSRDFTPIPLGIETSFGFDVTVQRKTTANVVGLLPGRDPRLAAEAVVISAHHDHLGIGKPDARGDTIYNGALDNGAGVSAVLALAKAFAAAGPPRRSLMVLFPAAEEAGLLGSQFFTAHLSPRPASAFASAPSSAAPDPAWRLVSNVNFDGGNIWGRARDITQIGRGKSSLDGVVDRIAAAHGRVVKPDQFPDRGSFYRSDQFNFAKMGIPALYLKTGTDFIDRPPGWGTEQILAFEAQRYHQPSDELDATWNFDGLVEDTRFAFEAIRAIADDDQPPTWNAGDEFATARSAPRP